MYFPKSPLSQITQLRAKSGGKGSSWPDTTVWRHPPGCVRRGVLPHPAPAPQPAAAGAGRDGPLRVRRGDAG